MCDHDAINKSHSYAYFASRRCFRCCRCRLRPCAGNTHLLYDAYKRSVAMCRTKLCRCAGRSLARSRPFSWANLGQLAVNVPPGTPTVFPPVHVRDHEVIARTISKSYVGWWWSTPPLLGFHAMAIEAIARLDLATYDVILCHL